MSLLALALWAVALVLIGIAIWRMRPIQARLSELEQLADNARRYESWRGGRKTAAGGGGESGADVMAALLRRQRQVWLAVGGAGIVLLLAGFLVR
jgi:hypothetical protein